MNPRAMEWKTIFSYSAVSKFINPVTSGPINKPIKPASKAVGTIIVLNMPSFSFIILAIKVTTKIKAILMTTAQSEFIFFILLNFCQ
jgi:hypothetical protein